MKHKFIEHGFVFLKPGCLRQAGVVADAAYEVPFVVDEVNEESSMLSVSPYGQGVKKFTVLMEEAIPGDVYDRLPHMVAARDAKLVQERKSFESEDAREERGYRERRDFMLQHGRPMTDQDRVEAQMAQDFVVGRTVTGRTPTIRETESTHIAAKAVATIGASGNSVALGRSDAGLRWVGPPLVVFDLDAATTRLKEALLKLNKEGLAVSYKDVAKAVGDIQNGSGFLSGSEPDKVKLDSLPADTRVPVTATVNGIKIGEIRQFNGNPIALKDHDVDVEKVFDAHDKLSVLGIPVPLAETAKALGLPKCLPGGKHAPSELFDTIVTVKVKTKTED